MSNYLWTQLYVYQMYSFFVCGCLRNKLQTLGDLLSVSLQALAVPNTVIVCVWLLQAIVSLKLCGNQITTLPPPNKWKCSQLRTLDLSRNQLGK